MNFLVTPEGLEEQLLGTTVATERPDLANMKTQLVLSNARMKKELKDIEDKILFMLSNSQVCFLHPRSSECFDPVALVLLVFCLSLIHI